jgi:DNA sulfur modification protein DndC
MRTLSLFENERLSLARSFELSAESLRHYELLYQHWVISFSGGVDCHELHQGWR